MPPDDLLVAVLIGAGGWLGLGVLVVSLLRGVRRAPPAEPGPRLARVLRHDLERVAAERDQALNVLDDVALRLERCTCGVGRAVAEELDA